jgi:hypothetical protein
MIVVLNDRILNWDAVKEIVVVENTANDFQLEIHSDVGNFFIFGGTKEQCENRLVSATLAFSSPHNRILHLNFGHD